MRILCTGSSSFIGAVLCPMLYGKHKVIPYDLKFDQDICNEEILASQIKDADAIIHLAACSTPAACEANPNMAYRVNVNAVELINRLRGDKPIFYPNTNSGYGTKTKLPIYDETSLMEPNTVYGKTKCEAEKMILQSGNCVIFRLASLFGVSPSMRWNLLLNFMVNEAFTKARLDLYEPRAKRNFLHVKDVCRAFIHAIDNYDVMKNQVYNVGLDIHPTKFELAAYIKGQLKDTLITEIPGSDPDGRDYTISNEKLKATGWKAEYSLNDGIRELIECLKK